MDQRPKAEGSSTRQVIDNLCRIAYELGLLFGIATIALVAIHGLVTHHANIDKSIDATHVGSTVSDASAYKVGETYPVYRFHQDWQQTIGSAKVVKVDGNHLTFEFDPGKFRWSMGRHGTVIEDDRQTCKVDMGSQSGFSVGDRLSVFENRKSIASVQLTEVRQNESTALVVSRESDSLTEPLLGKTVSEYSVATQVVNFNSPVVGMFDIALYAIVLVGYVVSSRRAKGSPFAASFPLLRARIRPNATAKLAFAAFLGLPTAWLVADFTLRSIEYIAFIVYANFVQGKIPEVLTYESLHSGLLPLFGLLLIGYEVLLWIKKVSPIKLFVDRIAFRGGIFGHTASDLPEHITMWCLQAIIVYTFARTIGGFFQGNLHQAISSSWPSAPQVEVAGVVPVSGEGFARSLNSIGYALTHSPSPSSEDALFATFDGLIYNACIFACLLGYGYSLLGYLWGKRIRNADFTVIGWLTNAVCYTPLFGVVIWRMLPPLHGVDPTVTPGFLRTATFVVAVSLNVVYTLSIWNLGTMFGVMTDKGVRTSGFYSVVRHPSYTLESVMFVMFSSRELSAFGQYIAVAGYFLIYWLRSEREDQFMSESNPDYLTYRERVPYKFIPGLY